mmetsp:Transcript_9842/g.20352  ORF Transcript_9842/g.20352 Transcript_9842/m.20352 type:complete len:367 (-) Transcript_9842:1293-2393(-)
MALWLFKLCVLPHVMLASLAEAFAIAEKNRRASIVTGAAGYLGKCVVHELLEQNGVDHQVFCLVRPTRVSSEQKYWNSAISPAVGVTVLPYDMLDGGDSVKQALDHADGPCCVYHVASNFGPTENHRQTALDNVQGTEDLVRTIASHSLDHRLVLTSSMAAVRGTDQTPQNGKFYTVQDWNTRSVLGANWGASYQWSKKESEQRARDLAQELGLEMVSLCPSFVFGPPRDVESSNSYSIELVGQWARGESQVQSRLFVDVRDVAAAHVAAGIRENTAGKRYIVSTEARVPSQDIASWLADACKETGLSDPAKIHFDAEFSGGAIRIGDKEVEAEERLYQELGIKLQPVKETIAGMAITLLEKSPQP